MKKIKLIIIAFCLLLTGCAHSLEIPLTVHRVALYKDGTCSIGFYDSMDATVWTKASADLCQYKVGDILK